uniref:Bifunctional inhibitor/plant lipid transfer protein/seed storage helical domain-containing protein n=1 Tax=Oryza rufipogon TaxID=4529 RepID=A0A0E0R141_ORYRU
MAKWAAAMEMLLLVVVATVAVAVVVAQSPPPPQCDPGLLSPCAAPIFFGTAPSASCCSSLKAQQGCFCQYAKDPTNNHLIPVPSSLSPTVRTGSGGRLGGRQRWARIDGG